MRRWQAGAAGHSQGQRRPCPALSVRAPIKGCDWGEFLCPGHCRELAQVPPFGGHRLCCPMFRATRLLIGKPLPQRRSCPKFKAPPTAVVEVRGARLPVFEHRIC